MRCATSSDQVKISTRLGEAASLNWRVAAMPSTRHAHVHQDHLWHQLGREPKAVLAVRRLPDDHDGRIQLQVAA